jgi:hypothetical protein
VLLYIQESILIGMLTFQGCDREVEGGGDRWDIKRLKDIKGKGTRKKIFWEKIHIYEKKKVWN